MLEKTTRSAVVHAGIGIPRHAVPVGEGGLPMGHWLGNQYRSTQHCQSRDFSGLAVLIR